MKFLPRGTYDAIGSAADRRRRFEEWACGQGVQLTGADQCRTVINTTPLGLAAETPSTSFLTSSANGRFASP